MFFRLCFLFSLSSTGGNNNGITWCLCALRVGRTPRSRTKVTMNVGTAHSEVNPNTRVMNSRGMWLSYILGIGLLHIILLSIPFASVPVVWTLTNLIHNLVSRSLKSTLSGKGFFNLRSRFLEIRNRL